MPDSAVEVTISTERGVRLEQRRHPEPQDQSRFYCLAICYKQVRKSTHDTGGLNALRGSTPLPSLRKARASLSALTFNCGIRFMSRFSPVSAQFLGKRPKKRRLSCVQEEVVAGEHPQREGNARLLTPGFEIAATHPVILRAAEGGDGTV